MSVAVLKMDLTSGLIGVDIGLWNKKRNAYTKLPIIVDTGASITTLSSDILLRAGYDCAAGVSRKIITASGIEYVKEITVDKIQLDTIEINDIVVCAHTFPKESYSTGVLGLNVLSKFDVNVLFSKGLIELTWQCQACSELG